MKMRNYGRRFTLQLRASVPGAVACVLFGAHSAFAAELPAASEPPEENAGASAPQSPGLKGYTDPKTGGILPAPAPGTPPSSLSRQEQDSYSTSSRGLTESKSAKTGGGYKLDLQGRFQSPLGGTIDSNGKVKVEHFSEPPGHKD